MCGSIILYVFSEKVLLFYFLSLAVQVFIIIRFTDAEFLVFSVVYVLIFDIVGLFCHFKLHKFYCTSLVYD